MTADEISTRAHAAYAKATEAGHDREPALRQLRIATDDLPWHLTEAERWDAVTALEHMVTATTTNGATR